MSFSEFFAQVGPDVRENCENRMDEWDAESWMREAYNQALTDFEQLLENAVSNSGGIDAGNGRFVPNAHWDYELRDQILMLKES